MARFTIQLEGDRTFRASVRAWEFDKRTRIAALVTKYADLIAEDAERAAPERTGALARSVKPDVRKALTDLYADVVVGKFYGRFLELGTSKIAARPFLLPAFEGRVPSFVRELRAILNR